MKRIIAFLVTSFIILTSMSDCVKNEWLHNVNDIYISVNVDGRTYQMTEIDYGFLNKTDPSGKGYYHDKWREEGAIFGFRVIDPPYVGDDENAPDIKYSLCIKSEGGFELDKWYPLCDTKFDSDIEVFIQEEKNYRLYKITEGMMRLTRFDKKGSFYYFDGEFWFTAVNPDDEMDVVRGTDGVFKTVRADVPTPYPGDQKN